MKFTNKFILLAIAASMGLFYFVLPFKANNTIETAAQQVVTSQAITPNLVQRLNFDQIIQSASKEAIVLELNNQEKTIWSTIERILSITTEECNALKQKWSKEFKNMVNTFVQENANEEPVSPENYQLAVELLNECGLDAESISILSWNYPSAAGAMDIVLFINEALFNEMSPTEKKFALAHEISHLLMKDYSTRYVIDKVKLVDKINSDELNNTLSLLSQFIEARADILAILRKEEYAQAQVSFMEKQLLKLGNPDYKDYPTNSTRLEIGKRILALYIK